MATGAAAGLVLTGCAGSGSANAGFAIAAPTPFACADAAEAAATTGFGNAALLTSPFVNRSAACRSDLACTSLSARKSKYLAET